MRTFRVPVARLELKDLPVYEPGRAAPPGAVKLASNENAHGPSPAVREIFRSFREIERYPDGGAEKLRLDLARHLRVKPKNILAGAGSDEIGDFLARAYLRRGDAVVYPKYTFVRYGMAAQACGARRVETRVGPDFSIDIPDLSRAIRAIRPRMVCLANPNNPTGAYVRRGDLRRLLNLTPASALFVLDEAYYEYAHLNRDYPDGVRFLRSHPNLVVLRTFSKIYALASLRVGYAVAHPSVISELHKVRPPFNVSSIGQLAARAGLADQSRVRRVAELNLRERDRLMAAARRMGFRVYPSAANFILMDAGMDGRTCFDRLARRGLIVRSLAPYGLARHVRLTVGTPSENRRLIRALAELRKKK